MNREKIAIITDSCADIPSHLLGGQDIFVVPMRIIYHDGTFCDGVDITAAEVYERLPTEIPKTSLPSMDTVLQLFTRLREEGYRKIIVLCLSSGLSGTHQMIKLVAENFEGLECACFDTLSGSLGEGTMVLQTAEYIRQGRSWQEILSLVPRLVRNTKVFFSVNTLEYLQKGGRIGLITSIAGTVLQIKPIISFAPDGQLISIEKVRGREHSIHRLVELAASHLPAGMRCNIATAHGNIPEDGQKITALLKEAIPHFENCYCGVIDSTLGTYVGPHLIGAGVQILEPDM